MARTMKSWTAGAALLLLGAKAPPAAEILYSVGPGPGRTLVVEIRLRGDADGVTDFALPSEWAGEKELWRHVSALGAEGGVVSGEGARRSVRHAPGASLVLHYRVEGGVPDPAGGKARPIVQPDWIFFHGEGVFARPLFRDGARVRFRWSALPAGWRAASDLDGLAARSGTLDEMSESVGIAAPDLKLVTRDLGGAPLRLAIRGAWQFEPEALAATIARIIAAEHRFWRDSPRPFLVAMAPLGDYPGVSYTGTGRGGDAFSILSTSGFELTQAARFLAHEYMHGWVPRALGGFPKENEAAGYWLSEGFDDYLASRVLLGSGLWSLDDYFADKNAVLLRYATSPARAATGAEIVEKFWRDEPYERISYDRGHLLALVLDGRIRAATRQRLNLDDVLREQARVARRGGGPAATLFPYVLKRVAGLDLAAELRRYVALGEPFLLPKDAFGDCAVITVEERKEFTRGYDADATASAGRVVTGVDPQGPAYGAGLRNGMKLIRRESGRIGDSTVELAYRVADGGVERVLRYRPEGKRRFEVQQARRLDAGPEQQARCRRRLGGA